MCSGTFNMLCYVKNKDFIMNYYFWSNPGDPRNSPFPGDEKCPGNSLLYFPLKMNIFLLAQTDGSVGNRLFGSADSFLENRTEGSAKPIIRSDTRNKKIRFFFCVQASWQSVMLLWGFSKTSRDEFINVIVAWKEHNKFLHERNESFYTLKISERVPKERRNVF